MIVSARSLIARNDTVGDVSAQCSQPRRVGRVHLGIGRSWWKMRGSVPVAALIAACTSCRRAVDIAAEVEPQRDLADAEGTHRGH